MRIGDPAEIQKQRGRKEKTDRHEAQRCKGSRGKLEMRAIFEAKSNSIFRLGLDRRSVNRANHAGTSVIRRR
jgi:hypothetical protein